MKEDILHLEGDKLSSKLSYLDKEIAAVDEQIKQLSVTKSLLKKDRSETSKTLWRVNKLRIKQDEVLAKQTNTQTWFKKCFNRGTSEISELHQRLRDIIGQADKATISKDPLEAQMHLNILNQRTQQVAPLPIEVGEAVQRTIHLLENTISELSSNKEI